MLPPLAKADGPSAFNLNRSAFANPVDEFGRLRRAAEKSESDRKRALRWTRLLSTIFLGLAFFVFVTGLTLAAAVYGPLVGMQLPLHKMGLLGEIAASIVPSPTTPATTTPGTNADGSIGRATQALPSALPSATPSATASATPTITMTRTLLYTYTPTRTSTASVTPTVTPTPSRTLTPGPTLTPSATSSGARPPTATPEPPPTEQSFPGCEPSVNASFQTALLTLINNQRESEGLPAYDQQSQLQAAAGLHSTDMACNGLFSHTGSDGSSVGDRVSSQGYDWSSVGENIYATGSTSSETPQLAFDWWMASPPNRANILSEVYADIGIGYIHEASSPFGGYFTAVFALP